MADRCTRYLPGAARRRRDRQAEEFIALLRQSAALLQAGRPPAVVWTELAGLREPCAVGPGASGTVTAARARCCQHHVLREAAAAHLTGLPPLADVDGPGERRHWHQFAGCLALAQRTGIPLADLVTRLADALDDGQDTHQARTAASAGPRSTARLLNLLPLAGLGLAGLAGAPLTELLAGPPGWLVLGTGTALAVAGTTWTRSLIQRAERTP